MKDKRLPDLKPCPFCGGNAFIDLADMLYINCHHKKNCICRCNTYFTNDRSIYTQMKMWNNRKGDE